MMKLMETHLKNISSKTFVDDAEINATISKFKDEDIRIFIGLFDYRMAVKVFCAVPSFFVPSVNLF